MSCTCCFSLLRDVMPSGADCPPEVTKRTMEEENRTGQTRMHTGLAFITGRCGRRHGGFPASGNCPHRHHLGREDQVQVASVVFSGSRRAARGRGPLGVPPGARRPGSWCRAAAHCWPGARASSTRPSEATLRRRWELCSVRCGSGSPSSWWMRRTLPSTRMRRRRSCTGSGAMRRAKLSGGSCGTKTPRQGAPVARRHHLP
jgi:hypothetical protein